MLVLRRSLWRGIMEATKTDWRCFFFGVVAVLGGLDRWIDVPFALGWGV